MPPLRWSTLAPFAVVALLGCDRVGCAGASDATSAVAPAAAAGEVAVEITCGETIRQQPVTGDIALDDAALCGTPWDSLRLEHHDRIELIKRLDREFRIRRAKAGVVLELLRGGEVEKRFTSVTSISPVAPKAAMAQPIERTPLTVVHRGKTQTFEQRELKDRYRPKGAGQGNEIPLCALAKDIGGPTAVVAVLGELPDPIRFTPAECESRKPVLRFGSKGGIRLRAGDNGERFLQSVRQVEL